MRHNHVWRRLKLTPYQRIGGDRGGWQCERCECRRQVQPVLYGGREFQRTFYLPRGAARWVPINPSCDGPSYGVCW